MSRPKPQVLLEHINKANFKSEQVLAADGIYAVVYDGKPINLRTVNMLVSYPGPRYKKTSFPNRGHALNLAKKLNEFFKTNKFSVILLNQGPPVE